MSKKNRIRKEQVIQNPKNASSDHLHEPKKSRQERRRNEDPEILKGREMIDRVLTGVFIVALLVIPLLIRVHTGQYIAPRFVANIIDTGIQGDVFTYYKAGLLYFLALLAILLLALKILLYKYEIRPSYINIPVLILGTFILFSGILAEYKGVALAGMFNRHEGALTILSYLTLFFVAANTSFRPWFRRGAPIALAIAMVVNVVIILFHFYGHDLYQTGAVRGMIIPDNLQNVNVSGTLWSTFNNPNYVSGFAAALAAFFMTLAVLSSSWKERISWGVGAVLSFTMMMAAVSTSGWVALGLTVFLIIPMVWIRARKKEALWTGLGIAAGFLLVFLMLNAHNPRAGEEPISFFTHTMSQAWNEVTSSGKEAPAPQKEPQLPEKTEVTDKVADEFNLPAKGQSAGSGRMYIWQKTIELIGARPGLGYGPDTLPYYFPQNDPYKISGMGSYSQVVDKPHSFYLQIAYGSGIIALLALLSLFLLHFYQAGRSFFTGDTGESRETAFQGALLAFFLAFTIQWLFNDSIVGTSPVFWTLLGVAATLNKPE